MSGGAHVVVVLGVGSELRTPLRSRPILGGEDQSASEPLPASAGHDVPALEIADVIRVAPFGPGANGELTEAQQTLSRMLHDEDGERLSGTASEVLRHLLSVPLRGLLGPQLVTELRERGDVSFLGRTDHSWKSTPLC